MECERVRLLLHGYVDGELDLVTSLDLSEHLQHCDACSREHALLMNLHAAVSGSSLRLTAPEALRVKIHSSLRQAEPRSRPWLALQTFRLASGFVLIAILFFAVGFLSRGISLANRDAAIAQDVQTAHVRSLMADHLLDVVSSDQHTVKPWFNGKLDFSPPIADLTEAGFPLIGGRLDYLGGHPAAALIFQRNKHFINLFIWPSAEPVTTPIRSSNSGYNLIRWTGSGMYFWAISDLNADELLSFVDAFQKKTQ